MDAVVAKQGIDAVYSLTVYGPLGVMVILGIAATVWMYRDAKHERKQHADELTKKDEAFRVKEEALKLAFAQERESFKAQLAKERAECEAERKSSKEELRALEERYIAKTENQLEKFNDLSITLRDVVGSALKQRFRSSRDTGGLNDGGTEG